MTRGMGQAQNQVRHTYEVSTDLTGNEYRFVNLDGSDQLQLAGAGAKAVVMEDPKDTAGQEATVIIWGKAAVEAGGSVSAFDAIASNGSGQAVTASDATVDTTTSNSTEDVAGDKVLGIALESGDSGDLVTVFVTSAWTLS